MRVEARAHYQNKQRSERLDLYESVLERRRTEADAQTSRLPAERGSKVLSAAGPDRRLVVERWINVISCYLIVLIQVFG